MVKQRIYYCAGYKYQLATDYETLISIKPGADIVSDFIILDTVGNLTIRTGYAWDGPSGPCLDIPSFMRASLVHDALYQLMREGSLPQSAKEQADKEMRRICKQDGMTSVLAEVAYQGVDHFGYSSCEKQEREVLTAP